MSAANFEHDRIHGPLPPLFPDGPITPEQWPARRQQLLDATVPLAFGGMPPKPDWLQVRVRFRNHYPILAGAGDKTVSFSLDLRLPQDVEKPPVLLCGDACFHTCNDAVIQLFLDHGFAVALFDRTELAEDNFSYARDLGVYPLFPELRFGAIAAWAWGYHRCVDALLELNLTDPDCICIAGHSRGGKATLLAGATDPRIAFTQTNESGLFGAGCFRYEQRECAEPQIHDDHSETLANMLGIGVPWDSIGFWYGPDMVPYQDREAELPFDLHFLKAAVAPRYLLETDSVDDTWSNPRGSYVTFRAAREAYRQLGCGDRIAAVLRQGPHAHSLEDFSTFLTFIESARAGKPFPLANADQIYGDLPSI